MKAIVVYESLWGNTAAIAHAIGEGIGGDTLVLSTAEATPEVIAGADLLVVGSPVLGFSVPSDSMVQSIVANPMRSKGAEGLSQPAMKSWLATVPKGAGRCAAFETRIWWSPGGATSHIERALAAAGYPPLVKGARFIVKGERGPLKEGEVERARQWGAGLVSNPG